ncbi:ribonuclease R [Candidatus Palauibacter sp.]|uniref:ribonuclease R n=1 Tax=Candidatus Palauibacter sp. TaxID=3101350 RepID=UPI003B5987BB
MVRHLHEEAAHPLRPRELAAALKVARDEYGAFREALETLEADGRVYRVRGGRVAIPEDLGLVIGRLQTIESGAGFVIPEEGDEDVFVRYRDLGTAVHGDRVAVRIERRERRGPRGTIVQVLERGQSRVVGLFRRSRGQSWVEVTEPRLGVEVFIPERDRGEAEAGALVVVQVTDWGEEGPGPAGRVERVLGRAGEPGVDVLAIQLGFGLADEFPEEVERAAAELRERGLPPEDLEGRVDCRRHRVVTIDPVDARDHDDALSIERLADGGARIGIHIADVSHYVREGDEIDGEAWERGTSVYLVDRVLPMLPHSLSSDLCSLVPGEDRLTLAAFIGVNAAGAVEHARFARAVIRSAHKLSYEEAQDILEGRETPATRRDPALGDDLRGLLRVSRAFRERRRVRGSLDFDLPESHVVLDDEGAPVDVRRRERLAAHMLVEDLMIAANEAVAGWAIEKAVPVLYRIHEEPNREKIEALQLLAEEFGLSFPKKNPQPIDFQRLLDAVKGRVEEPIVSMQVLRSLARARYATSNDGHFGLASPAYLHFTSPIRRYPDLVVHRQLGRWLEAPGSARKINREWLEATARHSSQREETAARAERDSVDLKKVEFMERHVGDHFEAVISGVTGFGLFVRLDEYDIEGLVHVSSLAGDYYVHDQTKHTLRGRRTRKTYRFGDPVEVRVVRVDREERRVHFDLV